MSIPKTIHYCWFGGKPKDSSVIKCMESWKRYCTDWVIKEWNEESIDIDSNIFAKQAYAMRKWAFVADYARLYALYNEGGVYFDTDVELVRPIDDMLSHRAFCGFESMQHLSSATIGAERESEWIYALLRAYDDKRFISAFGSLFTEPNVQEITRLTESIYGLVRDGRFQDLGIVTVYPQTYFSPKGCDDVEAVISNDTRAIHHFAASWIIRPKRGSSFSAWPRYYARKIADRFRALKIVYLMRS